MKTVKFIALPLAIATSTAFAEPPKFVLMGGYETGTLDLVTADPLTLDGTIKGYGGGVDIYINDNFKVMLDTASGTASTTATISNQTADVDLDIKGTGLGMAYVFGGRLDYASGTGSEHSVGVTYNSVSGKIDISAGGQTISDTNKSTSNDISYSFRTGLGNGLSVGVGLSMDAAELSNSLAYNASVVKSITENIGVLASYGTTKSIDGETELSTNSFTIGLIAAF